MYEFAIHYIWLKQLYDQTNLLTTTGEEIQVIDVGKRNLNAGPDVKKAHLRIANQLWVGDVELHVNSSEWNQHKHQYDPLYNTTILHVVLQEDAPETVSALIQQFVQMT